MSVERPLLSEPFEADIASIRPHSAMHSLVNFEVVLHRKALSALHTLKRPLSGMRPDVVLQTVYIQWNVFSAPHHHQNITSRTLMF